MRFLLTIALLYVLYLLAKGLFGRKTLSSDERRRDPEPRIRQEWEKQHPPRKQGLDYSKVKDADYRDL